MVKSAIIILQIGKHRGISVEYFLFYCLQYRYFKLQKGQLILIMVEKIYSEDFTSKVIKSPNTVLVDFFADWCGPCKMLAPVLDELSTSNPEIDFYKINVDENQDIANAFEISSIPCLIIFKDGEEVDRAVGFKSKQQLQEILNNNR